MNWPAASFDWNQARAFLATAEHGSLSAAARALGQTQPTVGRQVTALEDQLGVALFDRAGRGLILTEPGRELLIHMRQMGEAAERAALTATGQSQSLRGTVSITASDVFATHLLPRFIAQLAKTAPEIDIEIIADNELRDLARREADIAIRHVRPEDPNLTARLLGNGRGRFYASPTYLDRRGRPKSVSDLANHDIVGALDTKAMSAVFEARLGVPLPPHCMRYRTDNGVVMWQLVRAGLGIVLMSEDVGEATPDVEWILQDAEVFSFPIWLVTHRELQSSRRIRVVFDHLADAMTAHIKNPGHNPIRV